MDTEEDFQRLMKETTQLGLYNTLKKLSHKFAEKIPGYDKGLVKKLLSRNYEILLKKAERKFTAIPSDWTDEDILNALYLQICEYKYNETGNRLCKKIETLYKLQHTDVYQNSIGPVIKMIYSISLNTSNTMKKKKCSRYKQEKVWFDIDFIPTYLQNFKKYLPHLEMKFFTLPKIHSCYSDSNLVGSRPSRLPASLTFDNIFKEGRRKMHQEKLSYELDEGFVTPNEEHKEKSPCIEQETAIPVAENKKFDWDFKVVSIPPSKYKRWEKFDLLSSDPELPFLPKQVKLQHWLSKAPRCFTKITRKQLLEDIMSLLIGIPSTIFISNRDTFRLKDGVYTDDLTAEEIVEMTEQYIEVAGAFLALKNLSENTSVDDTVSCAFKLALKQYLYNYQLMVFEIVNRKDSNEAYVTDLQSLVEQVIYLKKLLVHPEELKGGALLEHLYRNMENSSIQKFYILTPLFLLPCVYYFRLIDDWIFLGRWHKDLPLTPCDITLVHDRQTWEEAYKPVQSDIPWFIPVQDLAFCGKALYLLSLSRKSEMFLNMLKSDVRPKVKLCLQSAELKELEIECLKYYEKVRSTFLPDKNEELDLVLCAQQSAKIKAQAFEESMKGKKEIELERKRKELLLREEDLIRSAKVKELKKHEEELDNMRVAEEIEQMRFKEKQQELETAKEMYKTLKEELVKEEKNDLKVDWKLKRHMLKRERQEFLEKDTYINENLAHISKDRSIQFTAEEKVEMFRNGDLEGNNDVSNKSSENHGDEHKFIESDDLTKNFNEDKCNSDVKIEETKYPELERNRLKILSSNLGVGESTENLLKERTDNSGSKELLSNVPKNIEEAVEKNYPAKYPELETNRQRALHSDFGRGDGMTFTVGQNEAERNKKKMLGTHFIIGTDFAINEKLHQTNGDESLEVDDECNKETVEQNQTESKDSVKDIRNTSHNLLDLESLSQENLSEVGNSLNLNVVPSRGGETDSYEMDETDQPLAKHAGANWLSNCSKLDERVKDLFKVSDQILLREQSLDYYYLLKGVSGSLKIVLDIQVKLMNEALLHMFLNEFKLLAEAGKLKKFFFLDGEYGKRLTSSLCMAIEKEKPSTLLTFSKLRDVLDLASQGDENVSFIVRETPAAFELTNPQVLSCLGMSYKFNWPLNLIFTDIAVSKYNCVFEYILSLQRVTWHLEQVWLALKIKSSQVKGREYTQIQLCRHVMSQFVCTLQWYIATTVFENCWQKFNKDVMEVTNFLELYRKHAAYIKEVIFRCFLNERSSGLMKKIQSLLKYILIFCQVMRFGEWSISEGGEYKHCNFIKLQSTFSNFQKLARYVIRQIEKLVKVNYQEGLVNLYNLFTLNSFYLD